MDLSNLWEAAGVILAAVGSAVTIARHEVRVIIQDEIKKHEKSEKENMVPIVDAINRNEDRMDKIQADVAYIAGYLSRDEDGE